jgi:general secretion pathway protein K
VLLAVLPHLSQTAAREWVMARQRQPWRDLEDAKQRLGADAQSLSAERHSMQSSYFEVNGRLRLNDIALMETSLIRRDGLKTTTVWQERRPWPSSTGCSSAASRPC